jgi:hypothetical protein
MDFVEATKVYVLNRIAMPRFFTAFIVPVIPLVA